MGIARPDSADSLTLSDGRLLTLCEFLGRGSLGEVHRAILESGWRMRRPVAVKIFFGGPEEGHAEVLRRLGGVARRLVCVGHPSIVQTLEIDGTDGTDGTGSPRAFTVTELVEGESLGAIIATHREENVAFTLDFALVVTLRVAEGLAAALFSETTNGALTGLVHGNVSPRQILVSRDGQVKIGDFGQPALSEIVSHVRTHDGLSYTPPEVASGFDADARSDVFSLGVILRELLVGPRFVRGTRLEEATHLVRDGLFHEPTQPTTPANALPATLRNVLDRALSPRPSQRYAHARAFAFDLRQELVRLGFFDAHATLRRPVVGANETPSNGRFRAAPLMHPTPAPFVPLAPITRFSPTRVSGLVRRFERANVNAANANDTAATPAEGTRLIGDDDDDIEAVSFGSID